MDTGSAIFLALAGTLFAFKVVYVLAAGSSLGATRGALFVSTRRARIQAALSLVPIRPGEVFVDPGCGDGRALIVARDRYRVRAVGYEINFLAFLMAKIRTLNRPGIGVVWGNFWLSDLSRADVVFCYLFPDVMARLGCKLAAELKEGARVISCNFPIPHWQPSQVSRPGPSGCGDPIYVYHFPEALHAAA